MSAPAFPLSALRVPSEWKHAAERGRLALYLSSWLTLPTAAWLVVSDELKLLAAGIIGAALMPLVLNLILFPGHLLARRHGRAYALGASALSAGALCAWTFAAASPVLEREYLPFLLRLLWAYCVAVLPLAIMSAADEKSFVPFVGAAQAQVGVLFLAAAQAADLPVWTKLSALILLAAASTWAVDGSWSKAHPPKR
jgi:hypothetical protein